MCRIVGRVAFGIKDDFADGLKSMLSAVAHGGPDDEGTYEDGAVTLGHRRLSIIDLSKAGHQPMLDDSHEIVISYNGEIYNYLDLKQEMEGVGVTFQTRTDTEVILKAYQCWGPKSFDKLEGIFAFALYDKKQQRFFLVRDHMGVKPLYYFLGKDELIFSSEARAFKALKNDWEENKDWRILFLAFGSIPHPFTTLSGVVPLSPGSYLELNLKTFEHQLNYYYQFTDYNYSVNSTSEALALIQTSLRKALQRNMISDAPLGIFLSGGIDSSLLTLLADQISKNVKSISVNFEDASYDESPFQKMILDKVKNVEHVSYKVTEQLFWEQLDDIWNAMDQPSIDGVNSYFVTRCAKRAGIKAVLSGLGADEIFGGYVSFERIRWMRRFRQLPFKRVVAGMLSTLKKSWGRLVYLSLPGPVGDYLFLRGIYTPREIASLLNVPIDTVRKALDNVPLDVPANMNDVEYASFLEAKIYMTNQLLKDTDYMGMWHGVEVRVPFLDVALVRAVHTIPPSLRYNKNWPKYLLTASNENVLPKEIVFRKKRGFTFPFALWISRSANRFRDLLPHTAHAEVVLEDFLKGNSHWSKCWSLAVLRHFK